MARHDQPGFTRRMESINSSKAWFATATELNKRYHSELGTLIYLPLEVREIIYLMILDNFLEQTMLARWDDPVFDTEAIKERHLTFKTDSSAAQEPFDALDLSHFGRWWQAEDVPVRITSQSLQREFESIMLRLCNFKFYRPKVLWTFFSSLSAKRQSCIRKITIVIDDLHPGDSWGSPRQHDFKDWTTVNEGFQELIPSLKSIKLDIGNAAHPFHDLDQYRPLDSISVTRPRTMITEIEGIKDVVAVLEILTKRWKRRAPNAEVSMVESAFYTDHDTMQLASVLSEVE
ncbi:hypothetical protein ACLMJK_003293 [Lecanora helva]